MPRQTLEQRAQRIYRVASLVATVEAFFLFIFGLDLTLDQILRFVLFGFPAPVVMYALDRRLIRHHVRPIQTALHALGSGQPTNPTCITQGWTQALNLPSLTLLRVLTVHAPSMLLPLTGLLLVANQVAGLGLMWWQFVILWLFWPITAVPHAILEYFLIARMTRAILAHLAPAVRIEPSMLQPGATMREIVRMVLGMSLPQPRIIRTATGVQLAWLFTFVSLMPMAVLGTSVYVKIMVREITTAGQHLQDLAQLAAATPTALPGQGQRWWRFDASGSPIGNIPPPELSFAVLTTLAVGQSGWLATRENVLGYAHDSSGGLVVWALPAHTARATGALKGWIIGLVAINLVVSVAIIFLLSTRVHRALQAFLAQMQRVQRGALSGSWQPDSADEFLDLGLGFNQMLAGLRDRETIKDTFGRFVSQAVAEAVLSGHIPLNGERREVSILFQDIRGFTSIAEQMDPEALVDVLNQFFTEMVAAVETEGGVVKQFLGDGVMALFGAPVATPDHATRAVRAALGMVGRVRGLNARMGILGKSGLQIGVGIHTGEVVAGKLGPDTRMEYGVVGDSVNVASRIEGLTKELQTAILISEATAAQLGPNFRLGRSAVLPVKGKTQPVQVVEVLGSESGTAPLRHISLGPEDSPEPG